MADIKTEISLLCKNLNFLYDINMKAEFFRLAKYNKSEDNVVETFWLLLSKVINLPSSENIVEDVKRYFLLNLKYRNLNFYCLPNDMSNGSRELLLAFAYSMAKSHLDKHIENCIASSPFCINSQLETTSIENKNENYTFNLAHIKSEQEYERALQWAKGRIDYNVKAIVEYEKSAKKISSKISQTTLSKTSLREVPKSVVIALNNPAYAKDFLEKTDNLLKSLQYHQRWLQNQSIFWEWMRSVLLEKNKQIDQINFEELYKFFSTLQS